VLDGERKLLHESSPFSMSSGKLVLTVEMLQRFMVKVQDEVIIGELGAPMF
jgi:hypothetical protein